MKSQQSLQTILGAVALAMALLPTSAQAEHKLLVAEFPATSHQGYLGVGLHDVSDERAAALKLKDARGVEVTMLDHDGPAAKVGFHEHDVILQMNGQDVASEEQLRRMLRETPAGRKADFVLSRNGQQLKLQVVLGDRSAVERASVADKLGAELPNFALSPAEMGGIPIPDGEGFSADGVDFFSGGDLPSGKVFFFGNSTGATVEGIGPQLARFFGVKDGPGLLVKDVRPETPAAKAGLKAGDVIVRADGKAIVSPADWAHALQAGSGKAVSVEVLREKHPVKLTLAVSARTSGLLAPESLVLEAPTLDAQLDTVGMAELQQQLEGAMQQWHGNRQEMDKAMAELKRQMESPEWKQQVADARKLATEAAEQWKQQGTSLQQQIQKAEDEARQALEAGRQQLTPMD